MRRENGSQVLTRFANGKLLGPQCSGLRSVSRAGESVSAFADFGKIVSARRRNQHARRVRYPEILPRHSL